MIVELNEEQIDLLEYCLENELMTIDFILEDTETSKDEDLDYYRQIGAEIKPLLELMRMLRGTYA
mgnify:CR=1 FL=1